MLKGKIGFAGEGWGAVSAVKGLKKNFEIQALTEDETVLSEMDSTDTAVNFFEEFECEIVVCAGYRPLIKKEILEKYDVINIHYSLLPAYRGLHSTAWAILNGEEELGLTIFRINQFMDDGPIIYQKAFEN
ncbi:MAG: formyltransferase family protein, partial [Bacteroidota bacterium]